MSYLPVGEVWEKGVSIDRMWIDAFFTEHVVKFVQVLRYYCLFPFLLVFSFSGLLLCFFPPLSRSFVSVYICVVTG